jgi:hypothetical protein
MSASDVGRGALWLLWRSLSLPVFTLLVIIGPVVGFTLGSLALLGVLAAFFFKLIGAPHFPFATMLAISVGLGFARGAFSALLQQSVDRRGIRHRSCNGDGQ